MKKAILLSVLILVILNISVVAQIKVNSSGNVGINNTNPTYRLDVNGTTKFASGSTSILYNGASFYPTGTIDLGLSGNFWSYLYATRPFFTYQPVITSDEKFKLNIKNIELIKDKILLLRPVTYDLNINDPSIKSDSIQNKSQFGFIAQELQKVFPQMVVQREDGILGISYTELIPVLVQALKEQQDQIDGLNKRITDLESKIK